jgi:endo-1,4-beta-xylanase
VGSLRAASLRAGVSVQASLLDDPGYAKLIATAFSSVTPENELKWETVEPEQTSVCPRTASPCALANRTIRSPAEKSNFPRRSLPFTHEGSCWCAREIAHYRGKIHEWDVVNEAVGDDGKLRPDVFLGDLGPGYIAKAFLWAHAADPTARLVYNDYGIEGLGPKSDAVYAMVKALLAQHVPIDAVGFQTHVDTTAVRGFAANLRRFAALGLDVELTETEVRVGDSQPDALHTQAVAYARIVAACRSVPRCTRITFWGLDDRDSFAPHAYPGFGRATLFDSSLKPKPAYFAVRRALR